MTIIEYATPETNTMIAAAYAVFRYAVDYYATLRLRFSYASFISRQRAA